MKLSGNKLTYATPRFITVATLVATLFFAPGVVLAIDKDAHEDRVQSKKQELLAALKKDNVTIILKTAVEQKHKICKACIL